MLWCGTSAFPDCWRILTKESDTTRGGSAAVEDDPELSFTLSGGVLYHIVGSVYFYCYTAGAGSNGAYVRFAYSGGIAAGVLHNLTALATPSATISTASGVDFTADYTQLGTKIVNVQLNGTGDRSNRVHVDMVIKTSTGGTFSFQWGTEPISGNITAKAGSILRYRKIQE